MPEGYESPYVAAVGLPREILAGVWWLGGCSDQRKWPGEWANHPLHRHTSTSAYLVVGDGKALMVETGHSAQWPLIEDQLESVLGAREVDYVFPSHQELPHCGNLGLLLAKYQAAIAVGDVTDYHLFFPELDPARLVQHRPEDVLDLGGRSFRFLAPVWNDLATTLWGFEDGERVLFSIDGLEYNHLHGPDTCGKMTDEVDLPPDELRRDLVRVLQPSIEDTPMAPALADLRRIFERLSPRAVASSHGAPVRGNLEIFIPWLLEEYARTGNDASSLADVRRDWDELLTSRG